MNKYDLKAYKEKRPQVYSLAPGINNLDSIGSQKIREGTHSLAGSMLQLPLTSRYNPGKLDQINRPQFNNTQKGKPFYSYIHRIEYSSKHARFTRWSVYT